ncbi:MAG: hypothetical protein O2979_12880 [Proteobacteria bacterium]|nr:hypothetical protein [Pseudomonadota bacterium]
MCWPPIGTTSTAVWLYALVAILLILGASISDAQELDKPLLLVASPDLKGPAPSRAGREQSS